LLCSCFRAQLRHRSVALRQHGAGPCYSLGSTIRSKRFATSTFGKPRPRHRVRQRIPAGWESAQWLLLYTLRHFIDTKWLQCKFLTRWNSHRHVSHHLYVSSSVRANVCSDDLLFQQPLAAQLPAEQPSAEQPPARHAILFVLTCLLRGVVLLRLTAWYRVTQALHASICSIRSQSTAQVCFSEPRSLKRTTASLVPELLSTRYPSPHARVASTYAWVVPTYARVFQPLANRVNIKPRRSSGHASER